MADRKPTPAAPLFFATPADFRAWFEARHADARELWVGFYRKDSGRPSITWPESVDEALCVGWIDGIRKSIDGQSYRIRFAPRKSTSNWSTINIARVEMLMQAGRMRPLGMRAFEMRVPEKSGIYAYENRKTAKLSDTAEKQFRANNRAWEFFDKQPRSYRNVVAWWVMSAKQEKTRQQRLEKLISESEANRRV